MIRAAAHLSAVTSRIPPRGTGPGRGRAKMAALGAENSAGAGMTHWRRDSFHAYPVNAHNG